MACRDMDHVISSRPGNSGLEPQLAEHLIHCKHCRNLTGLLDMAGDWPRPSESLLWRIQAGILGDLRPIRPLARSRTWLFACAIICLSVVALGALLLGTTGWNALSIMQRFGVFVALAGGAVLLAISMVRQMVPGNKHTFAPSTLLPAILVVLMMVIAATFRPQRESVFLASGVTCVKNGLTCSIPTGFLLWLILRRGAILYPKPIGAVAGGLAGLAGLSVLEINCANLNVFHVLLWHVGVVAINSLGGALVGGIVESLEWLRK
jgi:hypothetical protein